ncbi:N-acetyltransferase GCN5 [Dictyobacter sp. S3.2.2.5]|uniref:N-acetyltransferase GCN5 n=2 Tax=Dictyobacter halimunensis TaxID=3026934 RepID=A0ABQ6FMJ2_9CHLR|nr:N-acetyltransferase GCN5 [Dictyobacter sp. S3.2.2.5]
MKQAHVRIEPVEQHHIAAIQELASDPAIGEMSNVPFPYPADEALHFVQRAREGRQAEHLYSFAVISEEHKCVGICSLIEVKPEARRAELGYWIGRPYWGRGLATEAGLLVLAYAFDELNLLLVTAGCLERNTASRHVLEKLGFCLQQVRPTFFYKTHQQEPACLFELSREQWVNIQRVSS